MDEGIIEDFILVLIKPYPTSVWVFLDGKSNSPEVENTILELGKKGNIFKAILCLDNWVKISAPLKDISDINDFTEDLIRELVMEEYTLGIHKPKETINEAASLSKMDYKICHSLAKNSRKSLTDVANELGVTSKTVKRRLTKMENDGAVHTRFRWQPTLGNVIVSYMQLTLKPGTTRQETIAYLSNDFDPHFIQYNEFSNLPNFLPTAFCGKTLKEINDIQQRLKESEKFKKITVNVQYKAYHFDTWIDEYVKKMAQAE